MTYLYAGMGIAMLTAIMAMFEMANGLTGQQIFSRPGEDPYLQSVYQTFDKRFLKLVDSRAQPWTCQEIRQELDGNPSFSDISSYQDGLPTESIHPLFIGSCVFNKGSHRVLVSVPTEGLRTATRVFSCLLVDDVICPFERARG